MVFVKFPLVVLLSHTIKFRSQIEQRHSCGSSRDSMTSVRCFLRTKNSSNSKANVLQNSSGRHRHRHRRLTVTKRVCTSTSSFKQQQVEQPSRRSSFRVRGLKMSTTSSFYHLSSQPHRLLSVGPRFTDVCQRSSGAAQI